MGTEELRQSLLTPLHGFHWIFKSGWQSMSSYLLDVWTLKNILQDKLKKQQLH